MDVFDLYSKQKGEGQAGFSSSCSSSNSETRSGEMMKPPFKDEKKTSQAIQCRITFTAYEGSPVNVCPDVLWRIIVHNTFDRSDVNASGRCIGANQPSKANGRWIVTNQTVYMYIICWSLSAYCRWTLLIPQDLFK